MWVCLLLLENHHPWVKKEGLASEKAAHRSFNPANSHHGDLLPKTR
jgi:hypothetical protein